MKENTCLSKKAIDTKVRLAFAGLLLLLLVFYGVIESNNATELRHEVISRAREQSIIVQKQLGQSFSAVHALAALVQQGEGKQYDFDRFAPELLPYYSSVSSLQLAKDGIVSNIYPLAGNEKAIGHNLLSDPNRVADARRAIETKTLTLSGPYTLRQGGISLIGRLPIFLGDSSPDGEKPFWGFAIVVVNLETLLTSTSLDTLAEKGYDYTLSTLPATGEPPVAFAGKTDAPLDDAYTHVFNVPNGQWRMALKPQKGWFDVPAILLRLLAISAFSAFMAYVAYSLLSKPLVVENMVQVRTKVLDDANKELLERQTKLYNLAHYDHLTGLPNRAYFMEKMQHVLTQSVENGDTPALLYIDVDHFKFINDQWGHDTGDCVLRQVAACLKNQLRESDILGRIGGDEFTVVLPHVKERKDAERIARKINTSIQQPLFVENRKLVVSVSIGIALYPANGDTQEELLKQADADMYRVKKAK